jgi:hypothetical protein
MTMIPPRPSPRFAVFPVNTADNTPTTREV